MLEEAGLALRKAHPLAQSATSLPAESEPLLLSLKWLIMPHCLAGPRGIFW